MSRFTLFTLLVILVLGEHVLALQLTVVEETSSYTEYEMKNLHGAILPPSEVLAPFKNGIAGFSIVDQMVSRKDISLSEEKTTALALSSIDSPVIEAVNPGLFRGESVISLKIHLARYSDNYVLITDNIRFRVHKETASSQQSRVSKSIAEDHPLSTGNWYKIPIPKQGIYQLNSSYLETLGLDVSGIDPRNIQLWGTDGLVLPERNSEERPEFSQLPILVEGESDGSFDANDRVIFYGNSPHQITRTSSGLAHSIHPYSDSTYVFLTIGSAQGRRLATANAGLTGTRTVSTFQDLIWKEEELTKSEDGQKTGRYWLGQTIPASAQNQLISILRDTIPGIVTSEPILFSGRIYSRALNRTSFELEMNGTTVSSFTISSVRSYNSSTGESANSRTFTNVSVSPSIENEIIELTLQMSGGDSGANSFVDYLRMVVVRSLTAENDQLFFMPSEGGTDSEIVDFMLNGFTSSPLVLDITSPMNPMLLQVSQSGNGYELTYNASDENQILAQASYFTPPVGSLIANQNLHGLTSYPDYVIVTSNTFLDYAQELANHRSQDGLTPIIVLQDQILNEFSGGSTDPTAIRDYMKFLWDRAMGDGEQLPKYLLLFGDTTYDTKNIVPNSYTNHVLTFQSTQSIDRTGSYGTDDFFGLMDKNEGALDEDNNIQRIDFGIGRISAQTRQEAAIALDKIYRYENPTNNGDWQNLITFAGDDDLPDDTDFPENRDLHVWNADGTADRMNVNDSGLRLKKIYFFDYQEEITGAGRVIPGATEDLINTLNNGTLVFNYSGHGNTQVLADEEFFTSEHISELNNREQLALFVTATCQFGRYDDIDAQSGAEKFFFADNGGAIAAFTTTRVVYTSSKTNNGLNFALNIALSEILTERDENGKPLTFGEIYLRTKNTSAGSSSNSRRFILLGDPALRFALPDQETALTSINEVDLTTTDTTLIIKALDNVTLSGTVNDYDGNPNTDFNGEITITLLDAKRDVSIPQDLFWIEDYGCFLYNGTSRECLYEQETDVLFKGKALVTNGTFSVDLIVPKDISFSPNNARILMYANGGDQGTAGGSFTDVIFNGVNENAQDDGQGPALQVFLNDQNFFNGDLTNNSPTLIVELTDSSGINTTGTGVGHEITATIDTQPTQTYVLNDYYEGTLNDFSTGRIEYPMEEIPEGSYSLKVRAWDVHNNPTEEEILFNVANNEVLVVDNVYNYPNPMNNITSFTFEHNQQGNPLDVDIRVYTLSGKPVQHIKEYITNTFSSYASIPWNGRDRDNDRLGNGTYIYVLRVTADTPEGRRSTEKIEKLVVIR